MWGDDVCKLFDVATSSTQMVPLPSLRLGRHYTLVQGWVPLATPSLRPRPASNAHTRGGGERICRQMIQMIERLVATDKTRPTDRLPLTYTHTHNTHQSF